MRYYCSYFDHRYLVQGMTLFRSLQQWGEPFQWWVLCFDDIAYETLKNLNEPNIHPVALADFERGDEALLEAKKDRNTAEYFFTCTPSWPLYLLKRHDEIGILTYLDADLYFYSSPEPIFEEMGEGSIVIIKHHYPERIKWHRIMGIYNVAWLSFRNDANGHRCLEWWRERCLEWCYDRIEENRFADQKYLDDWPQRFSGVVDLEHKGANLAPWNWSNYSIVHNEGGFTVDGEPLIFFHFQGLRIFNSVLYDPVPEGRQYKEMPLWLRWKLYHPYVQALKRTAREVRQVNPAIGIPHSHLRIPQYGWRRWLRKIVEGRLMFNCGIR